MINLIPGRSALQACDTATPRTVPAGWRLADNTPNARLAAAMRPWGTGRVVMGDGAVWMRQG
jgi:hypothetical protein